MAAGDLIINFLLLASIAGITGTFVMTLFIYVMNKLPVIPLDIFSAMGSALTGSTESAGRVALLIHLTAGILFGIIYCAFFVQINPAESFFVIPLGLAAGFGHGAIVFFLLIPVLAENHPEKEVRTWGIGVALIYIIAHIIFGLTVASTAMALDILKLAS